MSRIFISHSSLDNDKATGMRDWLVENGWDDVFLDVDPERGLAPGARWQNALRAAANRCEAVIFIITGNWLNSRWCLSEYLLAKQLGKRLFPVTFGQVSVADLPADMAADHQAVDVILDDHGWQRLKQGLERAGLLATSFTFPPGRRPYPGFTPLVEDDAAIFFGRDAQILRALDRLRLMRDISAERALVILGASGAGKSSFLRAGLWPRLLRDDRNFWPLPVIRPEDAALTGRAGLYAALEAALSDKRIHGDALASLPRSRAGLGQFVSSEGLAPVFTALRAAATSSFEGERSSAPTLVLCVDQAEEFLSQEGSAEASHFLELLVASLQKDRQILAILCIRSDAYPRLQALPQFSGIAPEPCDLPPIPSGSLRLVVEGPAGLAEPPLKLEPAFVDAIVEDATGQDALPLLAFALERLAREYGADGKLTLQQYEATGRLRGALLAAVDEALLRGRRQNLLPKDDDALEALLRQAFIPHLARINEAGEFVRRVARIEDIPSSSRPIVDLLIEARLLTRDRAEQVDVVEVAHEALLREWPQLRKFLDADREFLVGKRQLGEDLLTWQSAAPNLKADALLSGLRLTRAQQWLAERETHELTQPERDFIKQGANAARARQRWRARAAAAVILLLAAFSALAGWQWMRAGEAAEIAEANAAEARLEKERAEASAASARQEKDRADRHAAESERTTEIARQQKVLAEEAAEQAQKEAQHSDARARLAQASFLLRDAPTEALTRAFAAARKLEQLGMGPEAVPELTAIANVARELPPPKPYQRYSWQGVSAFVPQPLSFKTSTGTAAEPDALTLVVSEDITGVVDSHGRAGGAPLGGSEADESRANDAAWVDREHFVLATGRWRDLENDGRELLNSALRLYHINGTMKQEYHVGHSAALTSVAVLRNKDEVVVLAGDDAGNLIARNPLGKIRIIPTGVGAPIRRIVAEDKPSGRVAIIFGTRTPDSLPPSSSSGADGNAEAHSQRIALELGISNELVLLGLDGKGDIGCAAASDARLYVCQKNMVFRDFSFGKDLNKKDRSAFTTGNPAHDAHFAAITDRNAFTAHNGAVTALALSPSSPVIATGSADGQIRLWLTNGALLAELQGTEMSGTAALAFAGDGRRLFSASATGDVRQWDVSDLAVSIVTRTRGSGNAILDRLEDQYWLGFDEQGKEVDLARQLDRLEPQLKAKQGERRKYHAHGRYVLVTEATGLRIVDGRTLESREVTLPTRPSDSVIALGRGSTFCAVHGSPDLDEITLKLNPEKAKDPPGDRHLYAIDEETASVTASWELPSELKMSRPLLAIQSLGEDSVCWMASKQALFAFSPKTRSFKTFQLQRGGQREFKFLQPINDASVLVAGLQDQAISSPHTLVVADFNGNAASKGIASPEIDGISIEGARIISSTKVGASVDKVATAPGGARIAVSTLSGTFALSGDVREVRIFDRDFNALTTLTGIPSKFDALNLNDEGTVLRGLFGSGRYEQDLRFRPLRERVQGRLDAWVAHNDLADRDKIATAEKDPSKAIALLRQALQQHPSASGIALLLANKEFYGAPSFAARIEALALYDKAIVLDPYDPVAHYMRGRALVLSGDAKNGVEDYSIAIQLPHLLPLVRAHFGKASINKGMAKLSHQLNVRAKGELHLRRAFAHAILGAWQSVLDDILWLRDRKLTSALSLEVEAYALAQLGRAEEAIARYQQAAALAAEGKGYGTFQEVDRLAKDAAWRSSKRASYVQAVAELYRRQGRESDAAASMSAAKELIKEAYTTPELSASMRALLDQFTDQSPGARCASEDRLRSVNSVQATQIGVLNKSKAPLRLYWIDYQGKRQLYDSIPPGNQHVEPTFVTHPWLVSDEHDRCLAILLPEVGLLSAQFE